jgi:hypothetical protein
LGTLNDALLQQIPVSRGRGTRALLRRLSTARRVLMALMVMPMVGFVATLLLGWMIAAGAALSLALLRLHLKRPVIVGSPGAFRRRLRAVSPDHGAALTSG